MLFRRILAAALICATARGALAAIDFTPVQREYLSEGITYQEVSFKEDQRTITIEVPRHWTCRGGADRLQLVPPQANFAEGLLQAIQLQAPQPLDEAATAAVVQEAVNTVPPGSQAVSVVAQEANPIILEGNESFGVLISYQTLGQAFRRSTIIVNRPQQRLVFRFTAPEKEFETLNRAFQRAIRTWK